MLERDNQSTLYLDKSNFLVNLTDPSLLRVNSFCVEFIYLVAREERYVRLSGFFLGLKCGDRT